MSSNVLYCDECAYMSLMVFYKVVLPILEVLYTVLIMISTLSDAWNFFSRILDKGEEDMKTGTPKIVVFRQRMICDRCLAKKEGSSDCHHNDDDVPEWKEGSTRDLVRIILGAENEDIFRRESMGVAAGATSRCFSETKVNNLLRSRWYERREDIRPSQLFVALDPNGGGPSHAAIVALARMEDSKLVICGMDSLQARTPEQAKLFIRWFIAQIRDDPYLKHAEIVYACENNNGLTSGLMKEVMDNVPNSRTVYEGLNKEAGIYTDSHKKNAYCQYLRQELDDDHIKFLRNFVTVHTMPYNNRSTSNTAQAAADTEEERRNLIRRELHQQMLRARPNPRPYTTDFGQRVISWSAKCNAEGQIVSGMNDDLLLALCIGIFLYHLHRKGKFYTEGENGLEWTVPEENPESINLYQ